MKTEHNACQYCICLHRAEAPSISWFDTDFSDEMLKLMKVLWDIWEENRGNTTLELHVYYFLQPKLARKKILK